MLMPLFKGFAIGAGMIIPIGAQNAYVLNQAIKNNYHFIAATICIVCDALLMSFGVFGAGALIARNDFWYKLMTWGGIAFLSIYGAMFFYQAMVYQATEQVRQSTKRGIYVVVLTTLAVTLLNPHVYLDTLIIIGSISGQYHEDEKVYFLLGTITASFTWFYTLSYTAARFAQWFNQVHVQRGVNFVVALIMWCIAGSLIITISQ